MAPTARCLSSKIGLGKPLDDDYAKQRIRNEPIVEITQIKGTSETHPVLSTRDEWAGFEIMPYRVGAPALSRLEGSYVREALLNGIALEQAGMTNPYQFGFIGSSDTHTGASEVDEQDFSSKLGLLSGTAEQRGSAPQTGLAAEFGYQAMKLMGRGRSRTKINGEHLCRRCKPHVRCFRISSSVGRRKHQGITLWRVSKKRSVCDLWATYKDTSFRRVMRLTRACLTDADGIERAYARGVHDGRYTFAQQLYR